MSLFGDNIFFLFFEHKISDKSLGEMVLTISTSLGYYLLTFQHNISRLFCFCLLSVGILKSNQLVSSLILRQIFLFCVSSVERIAMFTRFFFFVFK